MKKLLLNKVRTETKNWYAMRGCTMRLCNWMCGWVVGIQEVLGPMLADVGITELAGIWRAAPHARKAWAARVGEKLISRA
jgi:hypothetical protein